MSDRRLLEEFLTCSAADISVIANYLEDRDAFPVVPFQVRLEHVRLARLKSNCDVMCYAEGGSVRSFQSMKNEGSLHDFHKIGRKSIGFSLREAQSGAIGRFQCLDHDRFQFGIVDNTIRDIDMSLKRDPLQNTAYFFHCQSVRFFRYESCSLPSSRMFFD